MSTTLDNPILLAILAIAMLAVGPLVDRGLRGMRWAHGLLDGFVLASVGGLLVLHILPDAIRMAGFWAVCGLIVGGFGPPALERWGKFAASKAHTATLVFALFGLIVHATADGVAIAAAGLNDEHGRALALAVALHRIPVGLVVWVLVRPVYGVRRAIEVLVLISVSTAVGFSLAEPLLIVLDGTGLAVFQALVAGTLVHVIVHRPHERFVAERRLFGVEMAGVALAVALLVAVSQVDHHAVVHTASYFGQRFFGFAVESAPALLLGYLLAGFLAEALPASSIRWMSRGSSLNQAARGMAFGIPLPICSCGVVPLYHSLVTRGVPLSAAMAFLIATPELGVEALILSIPLLGAELTAFRLVAAMIVALAVGWMIGRYAQTKNPTMTSAEASVRPGGPIIQRVGRVIRIGFGNVLDETAPWILAGLAIAAVIDPTWMAQWVGLLPPGFDVVLFSLVGIPLYVCASGATPIAAALIFGGVSPGAAIAFLLSGPATNVTTFGVLSRLHGRKVAALFGAAVLALSVAMGWLVNFVASPSIVGTGIAEHHDPSVIQWLCLSVLITASLVSLFRRGPRFWVETILRPMAYHRNRDDDDGNEPQDESCGCGSSQGPTCGQ